MPIANNTPLPNKIKEMVLAELRSVKAIQTDYSKVIDAMEKHLEAYKKSKGTPAEKEHIQKLKTLTSQKKKLADELNAKVSDMYKDAELKVDEMNTTGGVEGYNTPFAFSGKDSEEKKGKRQADLTGYSVVKEGKYYVTYNRGRGQGKGLEMQSDPKTFKPTGKPKVFSSYNDAKKYAEKMEKIFRNSIGGSTAYWVSDEKMNKVEESVNESDLKGYLVADVVDDIIKSIGSKFVSGQIKDAPNRNYIYLKLTDIKFGSGVVKMLKSQFGIDAKIDKTFGNIPSVSFASKKVVSESVNEASPSTTADNGKELADYVLRWYDFATNYIDDGGQRRRALKKNEDIVAWFDSHPIDLKKEAFKILQSKTGSFGKPQVQRVFGKSATDK